MGSGKTTIGRKLASLLNYRFIDLDTHVERTENRAIASIFEDGGESAFRKAETSALSEVAGMREPKVVALGGGTICSPENLSLVKRHGLLVYLELPAAALASRLSGRTGSRPLLKDLAGAELVAAIEEKLNQRKGFYHEADIIVNGLNLTPQLLYKTLIDTAKKNIL